jgi:hypothetical protein
LGFTSRDDSLVLDRCKRSAFFRFDNDIRHIPSFNYRLKSSLNSLRDAQAAAEPRRFSLLVGQSFGLL